MRSLVSTVSVAGTILLFAGTAVAEDAHALLERAIEAHGGAARLERTKRGHLKANIEASLGKDVTQFELEETFDLPGRYRRTVNGSVNDKPFHVDMAVTGKEGWVRDGNGPTRAGSVRQQLPLTQHWHAILAMLLLLRDKDIDLTPLPDETKEGRKFAGLRATNRQGSSDAYFDKSTGLLARSKRTMPEILGGKEAIVESFYDDYRDIQGIHYPMKFRFVTGESFVKTVTLWAVEFRDKIDDSIFLNPQSSEITPVNWSKVLVVIAVSSGALLGTLWLIVRAAKRAKRETPAS